MIKKGIFLLLSRLLQGIATSFLGIAVFGTVWYACFSEEEYRFWLVACSLLLGFLAFVMYRFAILHVYDDRFDHDSL